MGSLITMEYFDIIQKLLKEQATSQATAIAEASKRVATSLLGGGVWHIFGTGHSHMVGEELFFRAGGLAPVNAIFFPPLMQHAGPLTSTRLERLRGLGAILFDREDLRPVEVILIVSNSGKNAVPVEFALRAQEKGLQTIALTSIAQSKAAAPAPGLDRKLYEICDVVIDNGGAAGDAAISLPGMAAPICPTSSILNLAIVEEMVRQICVHMQDAGQEPPVFRSANLPGGDPWNEALVRRYEDRIRFR